MGAGPRWVCDEKIWEDVQCTMVAFVGAGRAGHSWRPFHAETRSATESRLLYDLRPRRTFIFIGHD